MKFHRIDGIMGKTCFQEVFVILEQEIKLHGAFNNQLKYSDIPSVEESLNKIGTILDVLDIKYEKACKNKQKDTYYDTHTRKLKSAQCSIRAREIQGNYVVTLKTNARKSEEFGLIRNEIEVEVKKEEIAEKLNELYEKYFPNSEQGEALIEQITIHNIRNRFHIHTVVGEYDLCFDKFKYHLQRENRYSEDFYEIEIETSGANAEQQIVDPQIQQLSRMLVELFAFKPDYTSKYERGIKWSQEKFNFEEKLFLMFDLVGYSLENPLDQKTLIERLNHLVKDVLEEHDLFDACTRIPTGDGMILVFQPKAEIIPCMVRIIEQTRIQNRMSSLNLMYRTALHYGGIHEYQDINNNKNFAGDGINTVARIINEAKAWEILISDAFYKRASALRQIQEKSVGEPKIIVVKHGVKIPIRSFRDRQFGIGLMDD